jgi:hypothetical protein
VEQYSHLNLSEQTSDYSSFHANIESYFFERMLPYPDKDTFGIGDQLFATYN